MSAQPLYATPKSQYIWYMASLVTWVAPFGLQMVLFPWLIAVQLQESAGRLGIAQMCLQLPGLFLMLVGGVLADRKDPRHIMMVIHFLAMIPPLGVALLLAGNHLSYNWLICYALMMGVANAFVMPARDGMLNRVAGTNLQRAVTIVIGLTFGAQLIGFTLASTADSTGAVPLLVFQAMIISLGILAARKLATSPSNVRSEGGSHLGQLTRSLKVAWQSSEMRPIMILLFALGVFFGGHFVVVNPLIVRDVYGGAAFEISLSYSFFVFGTIIATLAMLAVGGLKKQGLALLLAAVIGALILLMACLEPPFWAYLIIILGWGLCGAVAMSMGRTIMQEAAPEDMRARIMAVFALANTGGMPLGALALGFCAEYFGTLNSVLIIVVGVWFFALLVWLLSSLARITSGHS